MASTDAGSAAESPAQRQARLRREKREERILSGGASRLDQITSLSGRPASEAAPIKPSDQAATATGSASNISSQRDAATAFPQTTPGQSQDADQAATTAQMQAQFREMLRNSNAVPRPDGSMTGAAAGSGPGGAMPASQGDDAAASDPMMQMLQQLMGAGAGAGGPGQFDGSGAQSDVPPGLPPALAAMLNGGLPGGLGHQGGVGASSTTSTTTTTYHSYIWKILHPVLALSLGIYIACTHSFTGSRVDRLTGSGDFQAQSQIFWGFATVELALQAARLMLEPQGGQPGMLNTIANFLPMPWKSRVRLVSRYSGIVTTLISDALVIIWVLGVSAWWHGAQP